MALAKRENEVFFLNPPVQTGKGPAGQVDMVPHRQVANLHIINQRLFFPYILKYKSMPLFHFFMRYQLRRVLKKMGKPVDIVWSFDLGNLIPFGLFPGKPFFIFHPVDEPLNQMAINAARGANILFSVTHEILRKYEHLPIGRHFVNHGVIDEFVLDGNIPWKKPEITRIGYSGNLLRPDIDRSILLEIVRQNENCVFEFWGSFTERQSNIGGADNPETKSFIYALRGLPNVVLHGVVNPEALAQALRRMDAFLICYDVIKDQCHGTNYHKVIEYLGIGRAIISNNITTYSAIPDLVYMVEERNTNQLLPALFKKIVNDLEAYNSHERQSMRIGYAKQNTYARQIEMIESLIALPGRPIDQLQQ